MGEAVACDGCCEGWATEERSPELWREMAAQWDKGWIEGGGEGYSGDDG